MAVYVDELTDYGWKLGASCHLLADSVEELHQFAQGIMMKRSWFQVSKSGIPHYDLVASRRRMAVRQGAIEITPTLEDLKRFKQTLEAVPADG
jgi:hypothetical protein